MTGPPNSFIYSTFNKILIPELLYAYTNAPVVLAFPCSFLGFVSNHMWSDIGHLLRSETLEEWLHFVELLVLWI